MITIISLTILAITLVTRPLVSDAISSELAAVLTMAGGAVVMHCAWVIYSTSSPFGPIWFTILISGTLGLITWHASGILLDVSELPAGISLIQIAYLYGIVPLSVSASPMLRWIWDYKKNDNME